MTQEQALHDDKYYTMRLSRGKAKYALFIACLLIIVIVAPVVPITLSYHFPPGAICAPSPCPTGSFTIHGSVTYALFGIGLTYVPANHIVQSGLYWSQMFPYTDSMMPLWRLFH